ncbi:gamma-glutamyltransferase [Rhizobium sp. ARZ01]|uniref:gamma-glutamyltransferase n=1 Tax=Rhizobium sp. ARZ01 TaxID=2769313 RepID=UPI0017817D0E|nr:gamma-glutamyltransferase [Rhizobium sp. ARZ01]MBD9374192.1 gamma-glutamyltransferase [Rhizobium sp. ARZ01]
MAATSHPLASVAAVDILKAGGTAADAAVAAVATLCVVEPAMTGIGGDCFCLVAKPNAPVWGYNGSGRAASNATIQRMLAEGLPRKIPATSPHAVTVPGAIDAWETILRAHGRFDLGKVLQCAIRLAEDGFPIAPRVATDWAMLVDKLIPHAGSAKHFLVNGKPPGVGQVMRMPALAATLQAIAAGGAQALYEGAIAADIAATVQDAGGLLTSEDLARHKGDVVEPISTNYRGLDIVELPPNGQGLTALVLLNILEAFDLKSLDPLGAPRLHLALEAARLAFGIRDLHIADPQSMREPTAGLLDKDFAKKLAKLLDPGRRVPLPTAPTPSSDTVYLTVVDRDRMAVSLINSLYSGFGTGICTEKTGVMLHNRGSGFVIEPDHPNAIAPGKRPMHTMMPALAMRDGRCAISFGVMGADFQPMGQAHLVTNMVDYGMDIQQAIDAPRAFYAGEITEAERGVTEEVISALRSRGHNIVLRQMPLGGGQGIVIDWENGNLIGGSDHRKDGCAIGY